MRSSTRFFSVAVLLTSGVLLASCAPAVYSSNGARTRHERANRGGREDHDRGHR